MIDWDLVRGFDWDRGNATKSHDKHQVTSAEAEQVFFNQPLIVLIDQKRSAGEARLHALGCADSGRALHLTFTLRDDGTLIRVISARDMSRKERTYYAQSS